MVSNGVGVLGGKETGKKKRASPDNNGVKAFLVGPGSSLQTEEEAGLP